MPTAPTETSSDEPIEPTEENHENEHAHHPHDHHHDHDHDHEHDHEHDHDHDHDHENHELHDDQVSNNKNSIWNLYGLFSKLNFFSKKSSNEGNSDKSSDNSVYDAETQKLIEGKLIEPF